MTDAKRKILTIDDDADILVFLKDLLESGDYVAIDAQSGKEGIRRAREDSPDLILLDIMMPEMDGHEACKALKADAATRDIPVIIITAKNDVRDMGMSLAEGADGFVAKPFDIEHLLRIIDARLTGQAADFYTQHDRVSIPAEKMGAAGDGDRIAFLDIMEPSVGASAAIEATECSGASLLSLFQLPRDENRVETTILVACDSPDCFGSVINNLTSDDDVEILGCRVYEDVSHIPVDIMNTPLS